MMWKGNKSLCSKKKKLTGSLSPGGLELLDMNMVGDRGEGGGGYLSNVFKFVVGVFWKFP